MSERQQEREWSDNFGRHFEVRQWGRDGRIYSMTITRTATGWRPSWDEVRACTAAAVGVASEQGG